MSQRFWFPARVTSDRLILLEQRVWTDERKARMEFASHFATQPASIMESRDGGKTCSPIVVSTGERLIAKTFDVPVAIQEMIEKTPPSISVEDRISVVTTMPGWLSLKSAPEGFKIVEAFYRTFDDNRTVCVSLYECGGWFHSVLTVNEGREPDFLGLKSESVVERSLAAIIHEGRRDHVSRKSRIYRAVSGESVRRCGSKPLSSNLAVIEESLVQKDAHEIIREAARSFATASSNALHLTRSWVPYEQALVRMVEAKTKLALNVVSEARIYVCNEQMFWGVPYGDQVAVWKCDSVNPLRDFVENGMKHQLVETATDAFSKVMDLISEICQSYSIGMSGAKFYRPEEYVNQGIEDRPDPRAVLFGTIENTEIYNALSGFFEDMRLKTFTKELRERLEASGFTYGFTNEAIYVSIVPLDDRCENKNSGGDGSFCEVITLEGREDEFHRMAFAEAVDIGVNRKSNDYYLVPIKENGQISGYVVGTPLSILAEKFQFKRGTRLARITTPSERPLHEHQGHFYQAFENYGTPVVTWMMIGSSNVPVPVRDGFDDEWCPEPLIESENHQISFENRCPAVGEVIVDPRPFHDYLVEIVSVECTFVKGDTSKGRPYDHFEYFLEYEALHNGQRVSSTVRPPNWSEVQHAPIAYLMVDPKDYYEINSDKRILESYLQRSGRDLKEQVTTADSVWASDAQEFDDRFNMPMVRRQSMTTDDRYTVKVFEQGRSSVLQSRKGQFENIARAVDEGQRLAQAADGPRKFTIKVYNDKDELVHEQVYDSSKGPYSESKSVPDPLTLGRRDLAHPKVWSPAPARVAATGSTHPLADTLPVVGPAFGDAFEAFVLDDTKQDRTIGNKP